jgi:ferric-dicitrate binding protein FerR (iron transport regulator)
MSQQDRHTIKKQLKEALDMNNISDKVDDSRIIEYMQRQWDGAAQEDLLPTPDARRREKHIWTAIGKHIDRRPQRQMAFYKIYSVAATIFLLLSIGISFRYIMGKEKQVMNINHSGICRIASFTLPDGSEVNLGAASTLTYPQTFDGKTREVILNGQAFFDVKENSGKPFIVRTTNMDVTAIGTAFEIFNYDNMHAQETVLLEGKVKVEITGAKTGEKQEFILSPDMLLEYDKQTGIAKVDHIDAARYTAWRHQGILSFENEKLHMILPRLEKWYGRSIFCPEEIALHYRFTFKVRDESLERILDMLSFSSAIRHRKVDEDYELYIPY